MVAATPFLIAHALGFSLCPTAGLLGVPCPSCGLTRALVAFFTGRFHEALAYHPLVVAVVPALIVFLGSVLVETRAPALHDRWSRRLAPWSNVALLILAALLVLVWIARFFGAFGGPVAVAPWR